MKILHCFDAYRKFQLNVKKFTRFQINPLIACRLDYFLASKVFYFQVKERDVVPSVKSDHRIITLIVHYNTSPRGKEY